MLSAQTTIINRLGLHARAAALLVKLSQTFKAEIYIAKESGRANTKNIMEVLMLGATKGTSLKVSAEGPDEGPALQAILDLIQNKFNEAE